jgi:excisionase family DNA binding protein
MSEDPVMRIELDLPDDVVERLAVAVAEHVRGLLAEDAAAVEYMTVEEAATYLRCSKKRIYGLTSRRAMPYFKVGSRMLFSRLAIDAWLAENRVDPTRRQSTHFESAPPEASIRQSRVVGEQPNGLRSLLRRGEAERRAQKRAPEPPRPFSLDDDERTLWSKAFAMSRDEFDRLTPQEFEELADERSARIGALPDEKKAAIFEWDPSTAKLAEMTVDEIEALADRLLDERTPSPSDADR